MLTLLGVLPLAVPGYVMAYALLATTGEYGTLAQTLGVVLPRLSGYAGAVIALSLSTFPYLFLNLRTAFLGLDPALEESAQALGHNRWQVFVRIVVPQLRPAFLAGGLLIALHVLGDFGVVSLMRYDTFSYALYIQYAASYDRIYAACLALMLLILTGAILVLEARLLKGMLFHRAGSGTTRASTRHCGTRSRRRRRPPCSRPFWPCRWPTLGCGTRPPGRAASNGLPTWATPRPRWPLRWRSLCSRSGPCRSRTRRWACS
jgi:iron(III) transport system permease protein